MSRSGRLVRRREFLGLAMGATAAWPLAADAQQAARIARIGFLASNRANQGPLEAFRQGLRDLGYDEGRNVVIEYRDAQGKLEPLQALAAELVALKVDVIVASSTAAALAAKQATTVVPIVFATVPDPVASGLRGARDPASIRRGARSRRYRQGLFGNHRRACGCADGTRKRHAARRAKPSRGPRGQEPAAGRLHIQRARGCRGPDVLWNEPG